MTQPNVVETKVAEGKPTTPKPDNPDENIPSSIMQLNLQEIIKVVNLMIDKLKKLCTESFDSDAMMEYLEKFIGTLTAISFGFKDSNPDDRIAFHRITRDMRVLIPNLKILNQVRMRKQGISGVERSIYKTIDKSVQNMDIIWFSDLKTLAVKFVSDNLSFLVDVKVEQDKAAANAGMQVLAMVESIKADLGIGKTPQSTDTRPPLRR